MRIIRAQGAARGVLILVCAATLTGGCGTPTRDEFKTFARAGSAYAGAVDRLLLAAGAAQVDSTSWTLALEKQTTGMDDKTYAARNEADVSRLEQISRLRRHAQLLGRYFSLAESLAASDDPAKTQAALDGVVSRLSDIKKELAPVLETLPDLGKAAVDLRIRGALRDELRRREPLLREHLAIQEQLLATLTDQVRKALSLGRQSQEQMLVMSPMLADSDLRNVEGWVSTRRRVLMASMAMDELEAASHAATELREAFEGIVAGNVTVAKMNALLADVHSLLSVAESIDS
jgi:uncharacterized coiled-coil protein SlyX